MTSTARTSASSKARRKAPASSPRIDITTARRALVLQGGGALGAYQAGVYAGVTEKHKQLDWVAGVSIGAVNAALIAGNPPEKRVERLKEFWHLVSSGPAQRLPSWAGERTWRNQWSASAATLFGIPGFFEPRRSPALLLGSAAPALHWLSQARSPIQVGRRCAAAEDTSCQKSCRRSTRRSGGLPAMSAALIAPIDTPATQSSSLWRPAMPA